MLAIASVTVRAPAAISCELSDLGHLLDRALHRPQNLLQRLPRLVRTRRPALHAGRAGFRRPTASRIPVCTSDQLRRCPGSPGWSALPAYQHLVGHHRKAFAVLPSPRRFRSRRSAPAGGLLGYVVDRLHHRPDLLAQTAQLSHLPGGLLPRARTNADEPMRVPCRALHGPYQQLAAELGTRLSDLALAIFRCGIPPAR